MRILPAYRTRQHGFPEITTGTSARGSRLTLKSRTRVPCDPMTSLRASPQTSKLSSYCRSCEGQDGFSDCPRELGPYGDKFVDGSQSVGIRTLVARRCQSVSGVRPRSGAARLARPAGDGSIYPIKPVLHARVLGLGNLIEPFRAGGHRRNQVGQRRVRSDAAARLKPLRSNKLPEQRRVSGCVDDRAPIMIPKGSAWN
jgi:hypothetical protein